VHRLISAASVAAIAISTAACGPMHDVGATSKATPDSTASRRDSANGNIAQAIDTTVKKTVSDSTAKKLGGAKDTAITLKLLKARTPKDSFSLLAAIRSGNKMIDKWPSSVPLPGAILPAKRIVAFYGNPLVKKMGVLGEYPVDVMLAKFDKIIAEWNAADPSTPVQPALHLITVVAQGSPGRDGKYRLRMADTLVEKVYGWAQQRHAILFLDIQVAGSTVQEELPRLIPFLSRPDVHLGIDPEFSMHYSREGLVPGTQIGIMDAADINYAVSELSKLVVEKKLPPKILIVHRFTRPMVRNAASIKLDPNVQVVMNMDGWGQPWLKFDSYEAYIVREPVQFTGFKIFFHNDTRLGDPILTPSEVLHLLPRPMYIQYQ
jgi:hypothetical protein